ncbi:MAG: hypothetical protein AAF828_00640 [Bacteroidota bacterium]
MKRIPSFLLLAFCLLLGTTAVSGQKKVLGYPVAFKNPFDSSELTNITDSPLNPKNWQEKEKNDAWPVIVDREGVKAYKDANMGSGEVATLKFGDQFYVLEVEEDRGGNQWLKLIDCIVGDRLKVIESRGSKGVVGWVNSKDLLLWKNSLVSPRTKIHLKAILLNKLDGIKDIPCDNTELVSVYLSPNEEFKRESTDLYRVLFVFKEEGSRYLLGNNIFVSGATAERDLVGWIDKSRVATWNIRIALEPNFSQEGFQEREGNPNLHVVGFKDLGAAQNFVRAGVPSNADIITRNDPITYDKRAIAKSDPKRFDGQTMRFPLLYISEGEESLPYFRSAVLNEVLVKMGCKDGKMIFKEVSSTTSNEKISKFERYTRAARDFNVFFVVENSAEMASLRESIAALPSTLRQVIRSNVSEKEKTTVKFGAFAYRDVDHSDNPDELLEFTKLESGTRSVENFLRNLDYTNPSTNGLYPVQNFAIAEAIREGKFNRYATNIIVVIGSKGDFSRDRLKKAQHRGKPFLMNKGDMTSLINDNSVNIIGLQGLSRDRKPDQNFAVNLYDLLGESSYKKFNDVFSDENLSQAARSFLQKNNIKPITPEIYDPEDPSYNKESEFKVENGILFGGYRRIIGSGQLQGQEVGQYLLGKVEDITKSNVQRADILEGLRIGGETTGFGNEVLSVLVDELEEVEDAELLNQKFDLYKQVYFAQQPKGAAHPSFSYVMFWPDRDLNNYLNFLGKIQGSMNNSDPEKQREAVFEAFCELLDEFSGDKKKDCEDYTTDEIQLLVQGLKAEGANLGFKGILLKDLKNKKKIDDSTIRRMIEEFAQVRGKLIDIQAGEDPEFSFRHNGTTFYWVKLDDIFFDIQAR